MSNDSPSTSDDSSTDDPTSSALTTVRREYLKLAGTAAISAAGLSAITGGAAAAEAGGVEFENTVDMVEDAGCDPTGGEPCNQKIEEHAADDTLLEFPEGTYLLDTGPDDRIVLEGYTSLGLAGEAEGVTFEFASGTDGYTDIDVSDVGMFVYENLDWDITAENCAPGFAVRARDYLRIENLAVTGIQDKPGGHTLQPGLANEGGIGVVENFATPDGCRIGEAPRSGVLVSKGRNNGTLRFVDCHLEAYSNNGIYAAASSGPIQVEGGVYRNCEPSHLRFSGEDSYIDGALVELDLSKADPKTQPDAIANSRGIWWETKNTDPLHTGGEIRNTEVIMRNGSASPEGSSESTVPNTTGGIVVRPNGGACTIKDSHIQMDISPRVAVYAKAPVGNPDTGKPAPPEPHRIVMENVTITGSASDWTAVQIEERPNSVIENCELDVGYRDGITLAECDDSVIRNTVINTKYGGGRPIVLWGTEAEISGVTTNNADPIPDGEDEDDGDEDEDDEREDEEDDDGDDENEEGGEDRDEEDD